MMWGRRSPYETDDALAFRDVLFGILGVLAAVVVILLLLPKEPDRSADEQDRSRGNIRVEVFWDDTANVDIDLWGQAPGLPPVGYSNKNGPVLNLVRDDLGAYADITGINYEVMFSRGLSPGEWTFNLHWFSNADARSQMPVRVIITIRYDDTAGSKERPLQIVADEVVLTSVGQELTIIRFQLDVDGRLIEDSLTSLNRPIRSGASRGP